MKDAQIVNIVRRIDRLNAKIYDLIQEIKESDHPNAEDIIKALWDDGFDTPALATHVVSHRLEHPEKWEVTKTGIRRTERRK